MLRLASHTLLVVLSTLITLSLSSYHFSTPLFGLGRGDLARDLQRSAAHGGGGVCVPWSPPRPPPPAHQEPPPAHNGSEYAYGGVVVIVVPVGLICWCCRLCMRDEQRQTQQVVVTRTIAPGQPGVQPARLAGVGPQGPHTITTIHPSPGPSGPYLHYTLQPTGPGGPNTTGHKGTYPGPPVLPGQNLPASPPPYAAPTGGAVGGGVPPPSYSEATGERPIDTDPKVDVSQTETLVERM